jgi:outer membrane protein assembly factor BamB
MTVAGIPCVAVHNFEGLLVARLDGRNIGKTVAEYPWKTAFANNIATPDVAGDSIILTSHYNHVKTARFKVTLSGAEIVWEQPYASKVCSPVIVDGHVYFAWRQVHCFDFETGELKWQGGSIGDPGSLIATRDHRLIAWGERGRLTLFDQARRSPEEYRELSAHQLLGETEAWPHVVLSEGRIFARDRAGNVVCVEIEP